MTMPPSLCSEELFRDVADVLVHEDDPLAHSAFVTPSDVRNHTWTCTPDGTICYEWFCHMYQGDPNPPRIDYRCGEFASQIALVEAGLAVALVPRLGRGLLPSGVVAIPLREPVPTRPVTLIWRATMTEAPAVRAIRALLNTPEREPKLAPELALEAATAARASKS